MSAPQQPQQPPPPQHQQQPPQPPQQQQPPPQQQQRGGGGGQGRGGGRGGGGRNLYQPGGRGGRGQQQQQLQGPKPISLNPSSGIPYGHVPAYLPGSASLVEQLDQRVLIVLRDGKHVIGVLSSFDQFSNMVLQDAVERRFYTDQQQNTGNGKTTFYCDVPLGVYVIRGDSMVLLGNIPPEGPNSPVPMKEVSLDEFEKMEEQDAAAATGEAETAGPLTWDFDTDLIA